MPLISINGVYFHFSSVTRNIYRTCRYLQPEQSRVRIILQVDRETTAIIAVIAEMSHWSTIGSILLLLVMQCLRSWLANFETNCSVCFQFASQAGRLTLQTFCQFFQLVKQFKCNVECRMFSQALFEICLYYISLSQYHKCRSLVVSAKDVIPHWK